MEPGQEREIDRLTNRHIGKLLDQIENINLPEIARSAIKREFWWLNEDIKQVMAGAEIERR